MKHLTLTLAVAAATLTSLTLNAHEPFLSPRAMENQVRTAPDTTGNRLQRGVLPGSPKGREQQIRLATSVPIEPPLATWNRDAAINPRALETFPWLAQTDTPGSHGHATVAPPPQK